MISFSMVVRHEVANRVLERGLPTLSDGASRASSYNWTIRASRARNPFRIGCAAVRGRRRRGLIYVTHLDLYICKAYAGRDAGLRASDEARANRKK